MNEKVGSLWLGTSGYSYPEWKGTFYPQELENGEFLSYYARQLNAVEINQTFYRFPNQSTIEGWCRATPEHFRFSIKANQRITHKSRLRDLDIAQSFVERCQELGPRLGAILYQLPPGFRCDLDRLDRFLDGLSTSTLAAFEFRHSTWFQNETFECLRKHGAIFCLSEDEAGLPAAEVTAGSTYVRLRKNDYTAQDLARWSEWIASERQVGHEAYCFLKHKETGESPLDSLNLLAAD